MSYWLEAILWAAGIIAVVFGFVSNYATVLDWLNRLSTDKKARPKLVVKSILVSKHRDTREDGVEPRLNYRYLNDKIEYSLYKAKLELYELLLKQRREYNMWWVYKLTITNNSEYTAYKIKISCTEPSDLKPIDYTIPVPAHQSITHSLTVRRKFIGTQNQASIELYNKLAEYELILEYSDSKGKIFYTIFHSDLAVKEQNEFSITIAQQ